MPPLALRPNLPAGQPDILSYGYGSGMTPTRRTSGTSGTDPGSPEDLEQWNQYIAQIQAALAASSGFARTQLEAQMKDAEKARQNAYRIAQLNAETSRYGVDVGRQNLLDQLKEQARQFDANHALEKDRFGLNVAEAYTRYAQTPDMVWALNDFKGALGRVGLGQNPTPVSANPEQPKAKTWEDFSALAGGLPQYQGGRPSGGGGSAAPSGGVADVYRPGAAAGPVTMDESGGTTGPDLREKAVTAVMRAMPPSETPGTDTQDWAALGAIRNLYFAGRPGEVERLGQQRRKTAMAGLARLGLDPVMVEEERRRSLPRQQSVRAY